MNVHNVADFVLRVVAFALFVATLLPGRAKWLTRFLVCLIVATLVSAFFAPAQWGV